VDLEMPAVSAVRYAVQTDGVTWGRKARVSAVPRPARPNSVAAVIAK